MNKLKTEGTELVGDLNKLQSKRLKSNIANSAPVLIARGLWVFTEGVALLVTSLYAIYQARHGHTAQWAAYVLTVSGVLVLLPAAHLLSRFFRQVGEVK
jgi:hypothetical protein